MFAQNHSFPIIMRVTGMEYLFYCYIIQLFCHSYCHSFNYKQGDQGNSPSSAVKRNLSTVLIQYSSVFVYCRLPKRVKWPTFLSELLSSIWGLLISKGRYFWRARNVFFCTAGTTILSIFLMKLTETETHRNSSCYFQRARFFPGSLFSGYF